MAHRKRNVRKQCWPAICYAALAIMALSVCIPLAWLASASFMSGGEITTRFAMVMGKGAGKASPAILPTYPTLQPYLELILDFPEFYIMFWNTCLQVGSILLGQLFVAMPAAWAFARFQFKGRKQFMALYIILMILPFQVTMVSSYLILDRLNLIDTHWSIILPGIFSTFPVFMMERFFRGIHESLLESARIDGAGELRIFFQIGLPMGFPGLASSLLLGFFEYWNAIEQPLTFLKDKSRWPLSLFLPNINPEKAALSFCASAVAMMPPVLLFFMGQGYLEEGIAASGIKE